MYNSCPAAAKSDACVYQAFLSNGSSDGHQVELLAVRGFLRVVVLQPVRFRIPAISMRSCAAAPPDRFTPQKFRKTSLSGIRGPPAAACLAAPRHQEERQEEHPSSAPAVVVVQASLARPQLVELLAVRPPAAACLAAPRHQEEQQEEHPSSAPAVVVVQASLARPQLVELLAVRPPAAACLAAPRHQEERQEEHPSSAPAVVVALRCSEAAAAAAVRAGLFGSAASGGATGFSSGGSSGGLGFGAAGAAGAGGELQQARATVIEHRKVSDLLRMWEERIQKQAQHFDAFAEQILRFDTDVIANAAKVKVLREEHAQLKARQELADRSIQQIWEQQDSLGRLLASLTEALRTQPQQADEAAGSAAAPVRTHQRSLGLTMQLDELERQAEDLARETGKVQSNLYKEPLTTVVRVLDAHASALDAIQNQVGSVTQRIHAIEGAL
ncbi:NUP62 [Symbiodinium sp. CCMP2592]|nr:NUP62 [Symbiodinium sp. CCMP2592]